MSKSTLPTSLSQKIIIESLAMDLKRVALGLNRGSLVMANRFKEEVTKREEELKKQPKSKYLKKLLALTKKTLSQNNDNVAEDILMYSTLFQNFALKKIK